MKILIIDRYPILRKGMSFEISGYFKDSTIRESESFVSFQQTKPDFEPDLIILGLNQQSGVKDLNVIVHLKTLYPLAGLIVYDETSDPLMLISYLRAGANGYLSKQNDIKELTDCITEILNGKRYINHDILLEVLLNKCPAPKKIRKKRNDSLTAHEYEIAAYLVKGLKTSWIALKMGRKMSTISTIKANIFKKLKVDNIISLKEAILTNQIKV